jgi:hypothetical protein
MSPSTLDIVVRFVVVVVVVDVDDVDCSVFIFYVSTDGVCWLGGVSINVVRLPP